MRSLAATLRACATALDFIAAGNSQGAAAEMSGIPVMTTDQPLTSISASPASPATSPSAAAAIVSAEPIPPPSPTEEIPNYAQAPTLFSY